MEDRPTEGRTLRQHYHALLRGLPPEVLLLWPPNLFAMTSDVLHRNGAYFAAICPPRPRGNGGSRKPRFWPPLPTEMYQRMPLEKVSDQIHRLEKSIRRGANEPARERLVALFRQHLIALRAKNQMLVSVDATMRAGPEPKDSPAATPNGRPDAGPAPKVRMGRSNKAGINQDPSTSEWAVAVRETARQWRHGLSQSLENGILQSNRRVVRPSQIVSWVHLRGELCDPTDVHHLHPGPYEWLLRVAPPLLMSMWALVRDGETREPRSRSRSVAHESLDDLAAHWPNVVALLTLHAIADEACVGFGLWDLSEGRPERQDRPEGLTKCSPALARIVDRLMSRSTREGGASLATLHPSTVRVLPKRHTPEVGITLRSFSSYLGHHRSSVVVTWDKAEVNDTARTIEQKDRMSVLLLPWPLEVRAMDFSEYDKSRSSEGRCTGCDMSDAFGLFEFKPKPEPNGGRFRERLVHALRVARSELGSVDMVVMPELSISSAERIILETELMRHGVSSYVAGIREEARHDFPRNAVYCKQVDGNGRFPGMGRCDQSRWSRSKHHRWKLTESQLVQYSLAYRLQATKSWWEAIRVERREVRFVNLSRRLTICPLICEDLARQDPIADLIRTVGPSLVITILMDGPQIVERWSARYASVLNDDPGSSVLTLTNYGMVRRYGPTESDRARLGVNSRAVALWRDSTGSRPITLRPGDIGVALSLNIRDHMERVADGRRESAVTYDVILGGVYEIPDAPPGAGRPGQRSGRKKGSRRVVLQPARPRGAGGPARDAADARTGALQAKEEQRRPRAPRHAQSDR
ncbi:MAG: hypothetical protein IPK26_11865 [Planctomycetes bacterium]|nr:hypothetical protein [Planctomycetota bacterium]